MNPGSLPPLSHKARALLAAEREISPQPELVRRRALLRARTALWHARGLTPSRLGRFGTWQRVRLLAVAALCATSAAAAWLSVRPAPLPESSAVVVTNPVRRPSSERDALSATPPPKPEQPELPAPPRDDRQLMAKQVAPQTSSPVRQRAASAQKRGPASEELALLDSARRSVARGDFGTALSIIERHTRSFPTSQLGEERAALRVRALKGAGLSKKADQAARDFESRYPKSILVPELNSRPRTAP